MLLVAGLRTDLYIICNHYNKNVSKTEFLFIHSSTNEEEKEDEEEKYFHSLKSYGPEFDHPFFRDNPENM